jgi:murein DD-endopeptidase MepM/ murein hydrolase activator NlpD/Sec-independent protein translocase protein TatA
MVQTLHPGDEDQDYQDDSSVDNPEDQFNSPAIEDYGQDSSKSSTPNPADLATKEAEGYGPYDKGATSPDTSPQRKEKKAIDDQTGGSLFRQEGSEAGGGGSLFRDEGPKKRLLSFGRNKSKSKDEKKSKAALAILAGLGSTGLFIVVGIIIILFATLKIPNLAEHIQSWQFARTARTFRQGMAQVNAEKIATDTVGEDAKYSALKNKYESIRSSTWGKLDKWRPELTYKNMQAAGTIDFKYSEPNLIGRRTLEKVIIEGRELDPTDPKLFHPFENRTDRLRLAAQIDANIESAMHNEKTLVRGKVAKKIRADAGIKLEWWEKKGNKYKDLKAKEAELLQAREAEKKINKTSAEGTSTKQIKEAEEAAEKAQKECIADDGCLQEQFLNSDPANAERTLAESADKAANSALDGSFAKTALEAASTTYAIAQPLCIIYDGSVEKSADSIDANNTSLQRSFYGVSSAASQQQSGETTPEAVGAMNNKIGDTAGSIPEMRAKNNQPVSTENVQSPEASAAGEFTLFNAILGDSAYSGFLNGFADKVCPAATDWRVGLGVGAAELIATFFTGGEAKLGEEGVKVAVGRVVEKISENLLSKKALKRMFTETVAIAGITVIAKMVVLSRMNAQYNGLARGQTFANQADMGGNIHTNEVGRQQFYGRPMTDPEVAQSNQADTEYIAHRKSQQGVYERYFAMSNPDSLLVNMGVSLSSKLTSKNSLTNMFATTAPRISSSIINTGFINALNPFKKQSAMAATLMGNGDSTTNYQIAQWGWTEDELSLIDNNPDYMPLHNDEVLKTSGKEAEIEKIYGPCFTETIGNLFKENKIQRDSNGKIHENDGDCAPNKLGKANTNSAICGSSPCDLVLRWRLTKRNDAVLDQVTGIANPTSGNSGSSTSTEGGTGISPDGFVFPQKTTKSTLTKHNPAWCSTSQANCHHDYNAADIFADTGTPVLAAKGGTVVFGRNQPTGGTGSIIVIKGDDNNIYSYIHLKSGSVKFEQSGVKVKAGDQIAEVGTNEDAQNTPSHLHFDVQPPPATTREGCTNAACNQPPFKFINPQPALVAAFNALPE